MGQNEQEEKEHREQYQKEQNDAIRAMMEQMLSLFQDQKSANSFPVGGQKQASLSKFQSTLSVLSNMSTIPMNDLATKEWKQWKEDIQHFNKKLQSQLLNSDRDKLLELTHEPTFQSHMSDDQKKIVSSLLKAILQDQDAKDSTKVVNKSDIDLEKRWWRHFKRSFRRTPKWYIPPIL